MGNNAAKMVRFELVADAKHSAVEAQVFRFGVFELDLRARELRRNGSRVKLQEQPFQVLVLLLEKPGAVVSREEIQKRLWPADTFVDFDHSLNAAIRRLRDALGDSAENPRFVETVARRGYRFLAPVIAPGKNGEIYPVDSGVPAPVIPSRKRLAVFLGIVIVAAVGLVLIGVRLGSFVGRGHSPVSIMQVSQLTANPVDDRVYAAVISPDGKYLAFSDETGFYLRQIDSGETHPLPLPQGLMAESLSWFPDSVHMVVSLSGTGEHSSLWLVSAFAGAARKMNDNGELPAVSPDGSQVAFIVGKPLHGQIWLVRSDGSRPRKLVGGEGDFFGEIAWSPDGSKLAYARGKIRYGYGLSGAIEILDLQGASVTPRAILENLTVPDLDAPLAWTSDGRLLYALLEPPPHQADSNIWLVALDASGNQVGPPVRLTKEPGRVFNISATSDGKRIEFTKGVPEPDVYVAKLESSGSISEPRRLTLDDRSDVPYEWTPDSKAVIFISDRTGTPSIYRQAIDQAVPELLVRASNPVESRLSPDGSQLLYVEFPKWGESKMPTPLMRVPLAGGAPQTVLTEEWISNHECARPPASVCIYSVVADRKITFFTYDPFKGKGTQVFELQDEMPPAFNWSLSPDGTTLAISKAKTEQQGRIRLVTIKNRAERWIEIKGGSGIASLDWAADSKSLWVVCEDEHNALLNVDLNGRAREVWRPKKISVGWAIPSRDGRYLALRVNSGSANAWMLERR